MDTTAYRGQGIPMRLACTQAQFLAACFHLSPGLTATFDAIGCGKIGGWNVTDYAEYAAKDAFINNVSDCPQAEFVRIYLRELRKTGQRPHFTDEN